MSGLFELVLYVYPLYFNLVFMTLLIGFNISLVINAKIYLNDNYTKEELIGVYKHFVYKHLIFIFISLFAYGVMLFGIYDFDSSNPFYSSVRTIVMVLFLFMCVNYIYIIIRTYILRQNIIKDEPIVCVENFAIVIYYFVCLNIVVCFALLFLNILLMRLY